MLQPKLTSVEVIGQYLLRLEYETGEIKQFDVAPYITGSWYGKLNDEDYLKRSIWLRIDTVSHGVMDKILLRMNCTRPV